MRLYAPGTRKGNRYWLARGKILGRPFEFSTGTLDERAARRLAREFEKRARAEILRDRAQPRPGAGRDFAAVAAAYIKTRQLGGADERWLRRMTKARFRLDTDTAEMVFGEIDIGDVLPMHIAAAANALYPGRTNQTKNRQAYTPAAAVLHFAAENGMRDYLRVRKLPEPKPKSRRPAAHILPLLIANADDPDLRLFLTIIHWQGWRATETLRLRWEHVDLQAGEIALPIPKANTEKRIPLHAAVIEALANVPGEKRSGPLFRWASYQSMVYHLKKLRERLGVSFTPHQARHAFASDLNEQDTTVPDIANAGSWTSEKSVARYIDTDVRRARDVLRRLPDAGRNGQ